MAPATPSSRFRGRHVPAAGVSQTWRPKGPGRGARCCVMPQAAALPGCHPAAPNVMGTGAATKQPTLHHPFDARSHLRPRAIVRVLDFYSGVGGLHAALLRPGVLPGGVELQVAAAVDVSRTANEVYAAEFGVTPRALDLTKVTAVQLDALDADLWLLTPPCQPYTTTKNARRLDTADPRAASLLHLISLLPFLSKPPTRLLLENVPGFVGSGSHTALLAALAAGGFAVQEFLVSPHQLKVPYSRPRYFAIALQPPLVFRRAYDCSRGPVQHPPSLLATPTSLGSPSGEAEGLPHLAPAAAARQSGVAGGPPGVFDAGPSSGADPLHIPPPLSAFLESTQPSAAVGATAAAADYTTDSDAADSVRGDPWVAHAVPARILSRFWRVLDVVTPASTYCNCFTKHYADNVLGAGSVLASADFAERFCKRDPRGRMYFADAPAGGLSLTSGASSDAGPGGGDSNDTADARGAGRVPIVLRRRGRPCAGGVGARQGSAISGYIDMDDDRSSSGSSSSGSSSSMGSHDGSVSEGREWEEVVVGLRFFSPAEVAAVHGLPHGWSERATAAGVPPKKQLGLLGNGLSVDVAAHLLMYMFADSR